MLHIKKMIKSKKTAAFLLALIIAVAFSFSALFVAVEAQHNCTQDESCSICLQLEVCTNMLKGLATGEGSFVLIFAALVFFVLSVSDYVFKSGHKTLINLKVKLSD